MAVTELPISPLSNIGLGGGNYVVGERSNRAHWLNSFNLPANANVSHVLTGAPGAVYNTNGIITTLCIGSGGGSVAILAGGAHAGVVTGIQQVYIAETPNPGNVPVGYALPVSTLAPTFPVGSLALAVLVLDAVGRIQQIIDVRPSYLSSAPNLGAGMTESIADPTKRVYFQNNFQVPRTYALTLQIPPDLSLPAPGFLLGGGAVVLSGNVIMTPTTYISTRTKGVQLAPGITQGYIDGTTGALTTRQAQTSGAFPANCLPIFEATVDSVNLVRNLVDWRPSYI